MIAMTIITQDNLLSNFLETEKMRYMIAFLVLLDYFIVTLVTKLQITYYELLSYQRSSSTEVA